MGFLGNLVGNLVVKGLSMASGNETSEIFGGSGTGEKKELFEKLLQTWNDVFKMEDFFDNPKISELKETVDLPVKEQVDCSYDNDIGYDPINSCDCVEYNQLESNCKAVRQAENHSKKNITHLKSAKDSIDFVYLTKLHFLNFNYSNNFNMYTTNCFENDERFYCFFRYKKGDNILTFLYKPYVTNLNSNFLRLTPMDILELSFKSGDKTLSADVYWQPEVNTEHWLCKPDLFFEKLGRSDVYENLKKFLEKINVPITAAEEEKEKKETEKKERIARVEQENKERAEKEKRRTEEKSKWKAEVDELLSKSTVESALDSFLSSDSKDSGESTEDKRKKLAEEYLEKGRNYQEQDDYGNAFDSFGKASALGNIDAKLELGKCYLEGVGTEYDEIEAFSIFNELAEQGNADAQFYLDRCYRHEYGTEEDEEQTFERVKEAAEQGDAYAQFYLGSCYKKGTWTEKDEEQALVWFEKAAKQGNANAQYELGDYYYHALEEEEDEYAKQGFKWLKLAAEQGHIRAQRELGACYKMRVGTEEDDEQGFVWTEKAAKQGDVKAQCDLGYCYYWGDGVKEDSEQAKKWFRLAAEQGDTDAQEALDRWY